MNESIISESRSQLLSKILARSNEPNSSVSDLTLRCIDPTTKNCMGELHVSRAILASASPVWFATFFGNFAESQRSHSVVDLVGVSLQSLNELVKYAYFLKPELNSLEVAMSVRALAERYQVSGLIPICDQKLLEKAKESPSGLLSLFKVSVDLNLPSLSRQCLKIMGDTLGKQAMKQLVESQEFLNLGHDALHLFLNCESLNIREELLFESIISWAKHQTQQTNSSTNDQSVSTNTNNNNNNNTSTTTTDTTMIRTLSIDDNKCDDDYTQSSIQLTKSNNVSGSSSTIESNKEQSLSEILSQFRNEIRFGAMDARFLLTTVADTEVLSVSELHSVLKHQIIPDKDLLSLDPPFQSERRFGKPLPEDKICISRGNINTDASWHYSGPRDELLFQVNRVCALMAVGLLTGEGKTRATLIIYKGADKEQVLIRQNTDDDGIEHGQSEEPYEWDLQTPIMLDPQYTYCLELSQRNADGSSYRTSKCHSRCESDNNDDQLVVTFSRSPSSQNGTDESVGAFPTLYFCVP